MIFLFPNNKPPINPTLRTAAQPAPQNSASRFTSSSMSSSSEALPDMILYMLFTVEPHLPFMSRSCCIVLSSTPHFSAMHSSALLYFVTYERFANAIIVLMFTASQTRSVFTASHEPTSSRYFENEHWCTHQFCTGHDSPSLSSWHGKSTYSEHSDSLRPPM